MCVRACTPACTRVCVCARVRAHVEVRIASRATPRLACLIWVLFVAVRLADLWVPGDSALHFLVAGARLCVDSGRRIQALLLTVQALYPPESPQPLSRCLKCKGLFIAEEQQFTTQMKCGYRVRYYFIFLINREQTAECVCVGQT